METIYQKSQLTCQKEALEEILERVKALPADTPDWRAAAEAILTEAMHAPGEPSAEPEPETAPPAWDFSREKELPLFASDGTVSLRPIGPGDGDFYRGIRKQYSLLYRSAYFNAEENKDGLFLDETLSPQVFYCVIEEQTEKRPVGYVGVKDTRAGCWELAVELDRAHTRRGLGPRSIRLYLDEVHRRTGKTDFRAAVEVDNLPSQKCFERLGAVLAGLRSSKILKTEEQKTRFEERNLALIDSHMTALAARLGVEPRKLLSHILDYRLTWPRQAPPAHEKTGGNGDAKRRL